MEGAKISTVDAERAHVDRADRRSRSVARLAVGIALIGALSAAAWHRRPRELETPIDVVGYPTFQNFNYHPQFVAYRLLVWVVPLGLAGVVAALRRWGPLSGPKAPRTPRGLVDHFEIDERSLADSGRAAPPQWRSARVLRMVPTAVVLAVAVSSATPAPQLGLTGRGVLAGLGFVALVVVLGAGFARIQESGRRPRAAWIDGLALVHTFAALVGTVGALCYFARHTAVVSTDGKVRYWPWIPIWFALVCGVVAIAGAAWSLARGTTPDRLERRVVGVVVGAAAVYLLTAGMSGSIGGRIQGFDDMQSVTGADLLGRGYFPWRDFIFIHGLLEDGLRSSLGFALFDHTLWATLAIENVLWFPLGWIGLYLLGVWAAPRHWFAILGLVALIVWVANTFGFPVRWCLAPYVLILLGETIRRGRTRWTVALTTGLFVEAVLIPETAFQVAAVVVVLVASDVVHREAGTPIRRSLHKTRDFVATGALLTALWCGFLALNGALGSFVDYYRIFAPVHAESGALEVGRYSTPPFENAFGVAVVVIALTLGWLTWRVLGRNPISDLQWVALAAAILAGLYGEKAVTRFDNGHVAQSLTVAMFLLAVLWAGLLSRSDEWVNRRLRALPRGLTAPTWPVQPVSALALVVVVTAVPSVLRHGWDAPANNKAIVTGDSRPLIGYSSPDSLDDGLLRDLRALTDSLAGPHGRVFDFTNSPGFFYYLLGGELPTKFFHISMAIGEFSQEIAVRQLKESRPEVVVFDAGFGLPVWDGPHNQVRHFAISSYLLHGWTPVVRSHNVMFLLRNDLVKSMPPLPPLAQPARTKDLYPVAPRCDWGFAANYLRSPPNGAEAMLRLGARTPVRSVSARGWAYDIGGARPVDRVLLAVGSTVVDSRSAAVSRPDVAAATDLPDAGRSGFTLAGTSPANGRARVYAVLSDGAAHPLDANAKDLPAALTLVDGRTVRVNARAPGGRTEKLENRRAEIARVTVPPGLDLRSFDLATFSTGAERLGRAEVQLSGSPTTGLGQDLSLRFKTLPVAGRQLSVRVGSCLEWRGFQDRTLYLLQVGGGPIDGIRLSGVS